MANDLLCFDVPIVPGCKVCARCSLNCLNSKWKDNRSLALFFQDVFCANNNRFAVVVSFGLAFHASRMRCFFEIFELKMLKIFVPLWWRVNSMMSQHIEICVGYHFSIIKIHFVLSFRVSISYGVWDNSIYVIFHTFKNVTITS